MSESNILDSLEKFKAKYAWDKSLVTGQPALSARAVEQEPYLVRISAAKRLRERAEAEAREQLEERVSLARVSAVLQATKREFA